MVDASVGDLEETPATPAEVIFLRHFIAALAAEEPFVRGVDHGSASGLGADQPFEGLDIEDPRSEPARLWVCRA
jgi:hypothetical protein